MDETKTLKKFSIEQKKAQLGVLMLLPAIVIICLIILYPLLTTLGLGFFKKSLMNPQAGTKFIGFQNFIYFFTNPIFWKAFLNNTLITVLGVFLQLAVGMIIALLLNMPLKARGLLRGIMILPWATPTFVAAFTWIWLLDAQYGIINLLLINTGILKEGIAWLGRTETALGWVIVAHVWKGLPWVTMVLLSGLQMVPLELEEAAHVDGASGWKAFWKVTLPSMKSVVMIAALLRIIWTFNWFDYVFLLTGGGPLDATMTWPVLIYKTGFEAYSFGRASALGVVMFLFLVVFTFQFFNILGKEEEL